LGEWSIRYQHLVIGETLGANDLIPRYHVGNIHLAYSFKQNNFSGKIFTSINNIYNQNYRVVERRPMPGTNLLFGININLKK
jgi:outer membrane receptor for Fe3+-dicitrate